MTERRRSRQPNGASSIYQGKDGRWHGYVTVGVKDDGRPDRRHVTAKTRALVTKKVRDLERERDAGTVRKAGKSWTIQSWLQHWIREIAPLSVSENTLSSYEVAVRVHLVPGLGAHRLTRLQPEHLERFYQRMQANGSKPATAHQAHRTMRVALGEAVRRGHLTVNVAKVAKAPRLEEEEIEPYSVEEVQRLLLAAEKQRPTARWVIALALGLRQGEVLGLRWADVDLDAQILRVRRGRLRPKYAHGCGDTCGRKPGYCPDRRQVRRETKDTKSRAGKRIVGLPDELVKLLRQHRQEQTEERTVARQLWVEKGYVFTTPTGEPLNPNTDYHHWKELLAEAGVRDARLHDARHAAATVLLLLGVHERVVMAIMGWSSSAMPKRYQHVTDPLLREAAHKVGGLLWTKPDSAAIGDTERAPDRGAHGAT
ncbi:tyrosine-type recombinase/integrase [Streptomyces sp. B8F3]|uniref:tyrosine-type recombinase/integrase n=1 Tax=unclassified Streptomyces TaxID=2593676 RepID=UPI00325D2F87